MLDFYLASKPGKTKKLTYDASSNYQGIISPVRVDWRSALFCLYATSDIYLLQFRDGEAISWPSEAFTLLGGVYWPMQVTFHDDLNIYFQSKGTAGSLYLTCISHATEDFTCPTSVVG